MSMHFLLLLKSTKKKTTEKFYKFTILKLKKKKKKTPQVVFIQSLSFYKVLLGLWNLTRISRVALQSFEHLHSS